MVQHLRNSPKYQWYPWKPFKGENSLTPTPWAGTPRLPVLGTVGICAGKPKKRSGWKLLPPTISRVEVVFSHVKHHQSWFLTKGNPCSHHAKGETWPKDLSHGFCEETIHDPNLGKTDLPRHNRNCLATHLKNLRPKLASSSPKIFGKHHKKSLVQLPFFHLYNLHWWEIATFCSAWDWKNYKMEKSTNPFQVSMATFSWTCSWIHRESILG